MSAGPVNAGPVSTDAATADRATALAAGERARLRTLGAGEARVEGALDFDTVRPLFTAGEALLRRPGALRIDLGGIDSANSAGLALLLEWLDLARARRVDLRFANPPDALLRIAALSNADGLLPFVRTRSN